MKFTNTEKAQAINFLNAYNKEAKEFKFLILKTCREELENSALNVQGIAMQIAKELFGEDFKSGKSGYNADDINRIFKKDFIKKWFTLENSRTYALNFDGSWVDFKKEHLTEKEEELCKECKKSFFKRLHDKRYQMIANTVTELRNENSIRSENPKGKKKSLAELFKSVKSQLNNKISENEEGYDKASILAELEELKRYISEIA